MSDAPLPHWERPLFQPGGYAPQVLLTLPGTFTDDLRLDTARHRCAGLPRGLRLELHHAEDNPGLMGFGRDGVFADSLRTLPRRVRTAVETAPMCAVLRGEVTDHDSLDYLRDLIGLVQALLESGAAAVFDPFQLAWHSPGAWQERFFEADGPQPAEHVAVLVSPEPDGTRWYHTRGMLLFGRPDISVPGVTAEQAPQVAALCHRFLQLQALGGVVPDGQVIDMEGLPAWTCQTRGDVDDERFNNRHLHIG